MVENIYEPYVKVYRDVVMAYANAVRVADPEHVSHIYENIIDCMNLIWHRIINDSTLLKDEDIYENVERLVWVLEGVGLWYLVDEEYANRLLQCARRAVLTKVA